LGASISSYEQQIQKKKRWRSELNYACTCV
jgi:hypothetical protein